jgi:NAD(P)-dependent dehydrogenase (short-subunit alcohol dehydrogenase family)
MTAQFAGRHAVVTGAGSGIGRATALALAEHGADLTLIARSGDALDTVAAESRAFGVTATPHPADVRDAHAVELAFHEAARRQTPDILVTAAGVNRPAPLLDTPADDLEAILDVNILGTLLTCRAFARHLISAALPGTIVTVSSQMGAVGYPGRAPYCASKHAINGLTKALALEWAPHRIRVNAIAPTFIETPLTAPMLAKPAFRADVLSRIPLGRIGTPADVTAAVRYLLSDDAGLITGHVLAIDGGWTAQ